MNVAGVYLCANQTILLMATVKTAVPFLPEMLFPLHQRAEEERAIASAPS